MGFYFWQEFLIVREDLLLSFAISKNGNIFLQKSSANEAWPQKS
jgi:hypothetical protein